MKNILKSSLTALLLLSGNSLLAQDTADSVNGAIVWADVCQRCHNVRAPEDYNKRAWEYSINHMRIRAGLTGKEARDILAFIRESKTDSDAKN